MSARERILGRIAAALHDRLPAARPGHVERARPDDPIEAFCAALEAAGAEWQTVAGRAAVPGAVAAYRARERLAGEMVVAPGLASLDWPANLGAGFGSAGRKTELGVGEALAGIAETGTVVLASGADTPTLLNFLPDHQLVVLERARVVGSLEEGYAAVGRPLPRVVNFVTGPSRTADVEQTLQIGAHGPRRLVVLLVE